MKRTRQREKGSGCGARPSYPEPHYLSRGHTADNVSFLQRKLQFHSLLLALLCHAFDLSRALKAGPQTIGSISWKQITAFGTCGCHPGLFLEDTVKMASGGKRWKKLMTGLARLGKFGGGLVGHIPPVGETERRGMEGERRERGAETISGR